MRNINKRVLLYANLKITVRETNAERKKIFVFASSSLKIIPDANTRPPITSLHFVYLFVEKKYTKKIFFCVIYCYYYLFIYELRDCTYARYREMPQ